ncbi:MAG: molybdopterin-dependent oxidoreductase [Gammaproteobacteria bacterium]|nr:molybdopterin-dependent oxidoreductase [Gammaproteobacteria bacterium]MBT4147154.1 molybdopterin-dependent oxidoreductase [Gammaproteobacteria bacterium]MBT5222188.1 molybdopterin-dependent oxidoreductase [Gammaproteobacteria bacterium]MBT6420256.1 molybdopterin-dependent oxidoreductase [Gammaproteobacteria bacterium]MBT6575200.1 molybdopterin-dependent oxidoreductase [Gammaproteobacteria bacterium]
MTDNKDPIVASRRRFIRNAGALALTAPLISRAALDTGEGVTFAGGERPLVQFPEKRKLILVHSRPPHLETPFSVFNEGVITSNDAFYVRYHLANFPTLIDVEDYRLTVRGAVKNRLSLSLDELKAIAESVEVVAVNQCSGNSRGYSKPRVFGAQLSNGAMGNAKWTGVPLRAVLQKAGVVADAAQVYFNGLDKPVLPGTPDFRKALDIEHALSAEPLLAWAMNDEDLPFLNGYPLKLIVPGYFGTYWVKHLSDIVVLDHAFKGHDAYFMNKAYRVPDNDCMCIAPGTAADKTRPISTLPVRSFITSVTAGGHLPVARRVELKGIAFDSGSSIKTVDVSIDGGRTWKAATLGENLGRFSFREWTLATTFTQKGDAILMVRASNNNAEVQPLKADWNPGGYRRHAIESTAVTIF